MTNLADWLLAQIAADEAAARAAKGKVEFRVKYDGRSLTAAQVAHILRHDPARVLAECAAKRAIVEGCQETLAKQDAWDPMTEGGTGEEFELARWVLLQEAQPYADRPGWDPAWKVKT